MTLLEKIKTTTWYNSILKHREILLDLLIWTSEIETRVDNLSPTNTGWQSRVDTTNTQTVLAVTPTTVPITIGLESNGGVSLLDANSKIIPVKLGDLIHADFSFTVETPTGNDHYIHIAFMVNGVIYRAVTFPLVKGAGIDENCSVSFNLPVGTDFFTYGGEFKVYSDVSVVIKNKYISVSLSHTGI